MKLPNITTILINLLLISYFVYFNVVYILPLFNKKTTEHFLDIEPDYEKEINRLRTKIKNTNNVEELRSNNKLLTKYRDLYKKYKDNLGTNAEAIIKENSQAKKLTSAINELDIVLKGLQIEYFLVFETLVDIYKNHKLNTDDTLQIGIMSHKYNKELEEIFEKSKYFTINKRYGEPDKNYELELTHKDSKTKIVIYLFYVKNKHYYTSNFDSMCENQKYGYCRWQFKEFKLKPYNFMGTMYNIPENTDLFLEQSND